MLTVPRPGRQQEKGRRPGRKKGLSVLMGPPPAPTPAPSRKRVSQVVRRHSETCAPSLVVREIPAKTPATVTRIYPQVWLPRRTGVAERPR